MTATGTTTPPEATAPLRTRTLVWRGLTRSPSGFVGGVLVLLILAFGFLGPVFIDTTNPSDSDLIWTGPSDAHILGTDGQGKDSFLTLVAGGAEPLMVGILAAFIAVVVATVLGAVAGFVRGRLDTFFLQLTDITMTVPSIVLMLVLTAMFRSITPMAIAVIIGLTTWAPLMRSVRAQVLSLRQREFVEAARLQNIPVRTIIFAEVLPNMAGYIFVNFILAINNAIYALVGMYLLGLLPSTNDNWGLMIQESWKSGAFKLPEAIPYIAAPLTLLIIFQIGLVTMGRSLEQALNPRLRER